MGYAVKLGKLKDGKPQLSYFTFLTGNMKKRPKSEDIPIPLAQTPLITKNKKIPCSGYFTLPFDCCIGGFIKYSGTNINYTFPFGTKPKSLGQYYLDPRGKKWPYAFQTRLCAGERVKQDSNTPAEVDYKWSYYNGDANNQNGWRQMYVEYVNYFSLCNLHTAAMPFIDGYLFGFRNREYFHIDYNSGDSPTDWEYPTYVIPAMSLKATSSSSIAYYLILTIPCIIDSNICDTMNVRLSDNQHGRTGKGNARNVPYQGGVNYTINSRDDKTYIDVNTYYTEFTDFSVPSNIRGSSYKEGSVTKYTIDNDHYGTAQYKWKPTGETNAILTRADSWNNYAYLNDHVARSELNLSLRVRNRDGSELKPTAGQTISLNFDFTIYRKNLMGNNISNHRIGAVIHVNKEFVVM